MGGSRQRAARAQGPGDRSVSGIVRTSAASRFGLAQISLFG
jgi:hypothetical protein